MRFAIALLVAATLGGATYFALSDSDGESRTNGTAPEVENRPPDAARPTLLGAQPDECASTQADSEKGDCTLVVAVLGTNGRLASNVLVQLTRSKSSDAAHGGGSRSTELHTSLMATVKRALSGETGEPNVVAQGVTNEKGQVTFSTSWGVTQWVKAKVEAPRASPTVAVPWKASPEQTKSVRVALLQGTSLQGRVVSPTSTREGTTVHAWARGWLATAKCDRTTGAFHFPAAPSRSVTLRVSTADGRTYSGFRTAPPFDHPVVLTLPRGGATLTVETTNEGGEPIADAHVMVDAKYGRSGEFLGSLTGISNAAGTVTWQDVPEGTIQYVYGAAVGYIPHFSNPATRATKTPLHEGQVTTIPIAFSRGGTIQGTVTRKSDEAPLADATVFLLPLKSHSFSRARATTGADGTFRFTMLELGSYVLHARHAEYYDANVESLSVVAPDGAARSAPPEQLVTTLTTEAAQRTKDIVLKAGVTLAGRRAQRKRRAGRGCAGPR